ncbi:hypothetical protein KC360_g9030 [Hortaea werneckii]|nr:hypothetical protein KC325_g9025 [Hortaea werneckii]KAI6985512.1 hypothetical protein KC359_g9126 [Hortaea werneckii]KAI7144945.1 hypothetical protein KC344_g4942 [Hortaea werneckii]KAI7166789.1 hypothetical protein KC360_g9030 [Hortaea werneckii]
MGIHGLLRELRPAPRISLARLSSDHYTTHSRPLRLAIDISIWLFQIQSGKGGSNPALRTFYYRLLRLLTLNIHPLFVFDGPNKPLFKRNKKVGGPGVKVASVPEFLAKQLLRQFGFPWHVAPGEAEAECAVLQRGGLVDAVLSEDVDTLMFGCGVTLRSWNAEGAAGSGAGGAKGNGPPTHVSVYREEETRERSGGIDPSGMILVALMSGGDYLPEGIPGCGPKVACDAARAGFGTELCGLGRKDREGLARWRERLEREIKTNESKFFSRRNPSFTLPEGFPNKEVLGYYTHPCVSSSEKLERLRSSLKWDQEIDFPALREFAKDAFDWRCVTGARKFIKNLAPAMLIRELRLRGEKAGDEHPDHEDAQKESEETLVKAIHGTRTHPSVDSALELRISFIPSSLVPLDLSLEEEDDDDLMPPSASQTPADDTNETPSPASDSDSESIRLPPPTSPTKKRNFKPYDPDLPEKVWILKPFLQLGCPLLVEDWEASSRDPKAFLKQRRKAREVGGVANGKGKGKGTAGRWKKKAGMDAREEGNAVMDSFFAVSKTTEAEDLGDLSIASSKEQGRKTRNPAAAPSPRRNPLAELSRGEVSGRHNSRSTSPFPRHSTTNKTAVGGSPGKQKKGFVDDDELEILSPPDIPSGRAVRPSLEQEPSRQDVEILDLRGDTTSTARHPPADPPAKSPTYSHPTTNAFAAAAAFPAHSSTNPTRSRRARASPTPQPEPTTKSSHLPPLPRPSGAQNKRSRCTPDLLSRPVSSSQPSPARSQRSIIDYYSPSPRRKVADPAIVGGATGDRRIRRPDFGSGKPGIRDGKGDGKSGGKVIVDLLSSSPSAPISAPHRDGDADVEGGSRKHTAQRLRRSPIDKTAASSASDGARDIEMRDAEASPTPRRRRVQEPVSQCGSTGLGSHSSLRSTHADEETSLRKKFVRCSGPYREEEEEGEQMDVTPRPARKIGGEVEDGEDEDGMARFSPGKLPDTVTKRRKKDPRKKLPEKGPEARPTVQRGGSETVEILDLAGSPLPMDRKGDVRASDYQGEEEDEDEDLPSPSSFLPKPSRLEIPREKAGVVGQMDGVNEDAPSSSYPTPPLTRDEGDAEEGSLRDSANIGLSTTTIETRPAVERDLSTTRPMKRSQPPSKTSSSTNPPSTTTYPLPSLRRSPRHHNKQDQTPSSTNHPQPSLPPLQITKSSSTDTTKFTTDESYPTTTSNPPPIKRKAFQLRASLEGSWKEVDLMGEGDGLELSKATGGIGVSSPTVGATRDGCTHGEGKGKGKGKGKWWRKSGVEVLDLTGD